jgi:hypothetical protein
MATKLPSIDISVKSSGTRLRVVREKLGLTLRDVENSSVKIAQKHKNDDYIIPLARLFDFETKNVVPSIFRMYSLAAVYRLEFRELLSWYGIDLDTMTADLETSEPKNTHLVKTHSAHHTAQMPVRLDPSFDLRRTSNLGRLIEKWGSVPVIMLQELSNEDYTYGYIGTDDFMMYPLLMPGTFVQVDESKCEVKEGVWRSEYERPIYFVESREGFFCCWCSLKGDAILLHPHPLSPMPLRIMRFPQEAEVVGQVVGIAMRLDELSAPSLKSPETKAPSKLN